MLQSQTVAEEAVKKSSIAEEEKVAALKSSAVIEEKAIMASVSAPLVETNKRLDRMLSTAPGGKVGKAQLKMWNKMHPLSTDTFDKYWKELGETKPMTDCDSCQYKTMSTRTGKIMTGMKLNNGGGFNGVLRLINTNGIVLEGTQRENKAFGLTRTINDDHVSV